MDLYLESWIWGDFHHGVIAAIREFMTARNYLEVETPMMQPLAGGALARPCCYRRLRQLQ